MSLHNIIFDFGGVICEQDRREYFYDLGMDKTDVGFYFDKVQREYHEYETLGELTRDEVLKMACEKYPDKTDLITFMYDNKHVAGYMPLKFDVLDYIAELKRRGLKVYGLTNLSANTHQSFREQYFQKYGKDFDKLFDGVTYSYQAKCRKPDLVIYKKLLKDFGIDPKTALFIDDSLVNVQIGEKLGIKGLYWAKGDTLADIKRKIAKQVAAK